MNRHSLLTSKAFYMQALLAWLCLVPAILVFRYLIVGGGQDIHLLFRLLLSGFVIIAGELFWQQPAYFLLNYTLYRYWYAAAQRPLGKSQFYGRVVAYYTLLLAGVVTVLVLGDLLQYSILYFFLSFVLLVLMAYFSRYLIPSYARYHRLYATQNRT